MSDLLANELVRKYFGAWVGLTITKEFKLPDVAYNVLRAMQEPIREGERYLDIQIYGDTTEQTATDENLNHREHWGTLRLPDRFQIERKECLPEYQLQCPSCGDNFRHPCRGTAKSSAVEEKIKDIVFRAGGNDKMAEGLYALVDLVRKEGKCQKPT